MRSYVDDRHIRFLKRLPFIFLRRYHLIFIKNTFEDLKKEKLKHLLLQFINDKFQKRLVEKYKNQFEAITKIKNLRIAFKSPAILGSRSSFRGKLYHFKCKK